MSDILIVEKSEGVATLTLNRPEAMNALSRALRKELTDGFRSIAADDAVEVVILTGKGRAFTAGLDLKELAGEGGRQGSAADAVSSGNDLLSAMNACPQPIIGAINGFAITGGFEVALACDLLIASTEARFADTHARVGIIPGWGLSQKLSRLIGMSRAKELSLTGNYLSAEKAEAWGLVSRVVAPEALLPTCRALAEDMLSCDPTTLRGLKKLIDEGYALPFGEALAFEREANRAHPAPDPAEMAERRKAVQARARKQVS